MTSFRAIALATALAAASLSTAAMAQEKADFAACDGRLKPKKSDDGMRGEAARTGYSQFSHLFGKPGENHTAKVIACTKALADPRLLPTQTLRRAHILRERAASYLATGKTDSAIADIDAAETAVADRKGEPFFDRSMGVSLALLRAVGLAQQGKTGEAARIAEEAAGKRPYALEVQMAAAVIRQADRATKAGTPSPFGQLVRIEPAAARAALAAELGAGNFAQAAALGRTMPIKWTDPAASLRSFLVDRTGTPLGMFDQVGPALDLAYAYAATGDVAAAKALVGDARAQLDKLLAALDKPAPGATTAPAPAPAPAATLTPASVDGATPASAAPPTPARPAKADLVESIAGPRLRLAEARIALAEGRAADAATIGTGKLPANAAALEYFTALRAAADAGLYKGTTPDPAPLAGRLGTERAVNLSGLADSLLFAPETPRSVIDYQKSRPNILGALIGGALSMGTSLLGGIERTGGFRSTPNADGSVKVEYTGSTTSGPMVQEMTLLRAAELARDAGKPRFAVLDRKDYTRWMVTSQYGVERSRVPAGYQTELQVKYLDADADPATSLDAVAVIDALGPLYYESVKTAAK